MNSINQQISSLNGEREYSPSPLQKGFRNNLVGSTAIASPLQQYQPRPMTPQQGMQYPSVSNPGLAQHQSIPPSPLSNIPQPISNSPAAYPQNFTSSNSFQMSSSLSRPLNIPPSPSPIFTPDDIADPSLNTAEGRMNAVAKEREKMKALGTQKQMMEGLLENKFKDFKNIINKNLKEKFDTELKRALFHLWKHYKNCNEKNMSPEDIEKSIYESLRKVYFETNELKEKNRQLSDQVTMKEIETANVINKQIKENNTLSQPMNQPQPMGNMNQFDQTQRRYFLESQIGVINKENQMTENRIKELLDERPNRIYEAKLVLETQGRELMDEQSRRLTLEYCPTDQPTLVDLRNQVATLGNDYLSLKQQWIDRGCGPNPTDHKIMLLEQELFDLEKKYDSLRH